MTANLNNPGGQRFIQLTGFDATNLANLNQALRNIQTSLANMNGDEALTQDLNFGGFTGINVAEPVNSEDIVNKEYADANYGAAAVRKALLTLQQGSNPLAPIAGGTAANGAIPGTHAVRLATSAASYSPGQLFYETDRTVFYMVQVAGGVNAWVWASGTYTSAIANEPADLGVNDTGFRFTATDTAQHFRWTGTVYVEEYEIIDAGTNTDPGILNLIHRSTGTPAANFGAALQYYLDSSTNALRKAGYAAAIWNVPTNLGEGADYIIGLMSGGAVASQKFRITKDGDAIITRNITAASGSITASGAIEGSDFQATGHITLYNNTIPADGQVLIGDTSNSRFDAAVLTPGAGISITNAGGSITIASSSGGYPEAVETVALTAQVAAISSTNFTGTAAPGTYQLSYSLMDTTAAAGAGAIQLQVAYTNTAGSATQSSSAVILTSLSLSATGTGVMIIQLASGNIAYSTILTGIISTAQYALYMTLVRLS